MSGTFYDNGLRTQHVTAAASLTSAATIQTIRGPGGKVGRVRDLTLTITTAVTVADSAVNIGPSGAATAQLNGMVVPFTGSSIGDRVVPVGGGAGVAASLAAGSDIAADVDTLVTTDGGATAGAADVFTIVTWW